MASDQLQADIILLTVNAHEQAKLREALESKTGRTGIQVQGPSNEIYLDFGSLNGQKVAVAKSLMGAMGDGASFDTVSNALSDLNPRVLVAVGIAWGARDADGQQIGDVLLSTQIRDAQHHKVKDGETILRGDVSSARGTLVKAFSAAAENGGKRVHEGLLLSIETLFDNLDARNSFLKAEPTAIGGEMEGSGLLKALKKVEHSVDWIVVKSICDWGYKKNADPKQKELDQQYAASEAAHLCVETISKFRLTRDLPSSRDAGRSSRTDYVGQKGELLESNLNKTGPERSIRSTVEAYIAKNSSLTIDVGYPIVRRDWSTNVIFELYRLSEELGSVRQFLYFHEGASQSATHQYLIKNNIISKDSQLIILTEKPANVQHVENRKNNLRAQFSTPVVYFIDEFGSQLLYRDQFKEFIPFSLPVYIEGSAETSASTHAASALQELKKWYESEANPLLIVKGHGGIGKTTLVKKFLNEIHGENREVGILFIDSHEIIGELERRSRIQQKIDDVYDFYHAQHERHSANDTPLSKDLLSLSVDNGSLVIVLDGIDEVIAKLGQKFDSVSFIRSVSTGYSTNLKRAKILITCRDYFWDSKQHTVPVERLDLQPFTRAMAEDFFLQSVEDGKTDRAMAIADKLALRDKLPQNEIYIPYILDLIVYLIKRRPDAPVETDVEALPSINRLLNLDLSNDFLVANVCYREIIKLDSLSVAAQLAFFSELSVSEGGQISIYDVKNVLTKLSGPGTEIDANELQRLQGHPLLALRNDLLTFRYDFFNEYFKALFAVNYFKERSIDKFNLKIVNIGADYLRFDSEFVKSICDRVELDDDLSLFFSETIEAVKFANLSTNEKNDNLRQRACSGVFALYLSLLRNSPKKFDMSACTEAMNDLFKEKESVRELSLINVGSNSSAKPIFDFRGLRLESCHFERFDFFWECSIDENTRFEGCTFNLLEPRKNVNPTFYPKTFSNTCNTSGIAHIIAKKEESTGQRTDEVRADVIRLFKLFLSRGNFYPQKQDFIKGKFFTGVYLPVLLKGKVIEEYVDPKKPTMNQYRIASDYLTILKHIDQGAPSVEFDRVLQLFSL